MYVNVTRIERDERVATSDDSKGREYEECGRLLDVNAIEVLADRDTEAAEPTQHTVPQVRPWARYFARIFDLWIFSLLVGITVGVFAPSVLGIPEIFLTMGILFVWIFQEAILLANCGTTPGKWLFNIRVRDGKGQKLEFSDALNRSFSVWLKGMGAGIPLISFITLLSSRSKLKRDGVATWDEQGGYVVTHGKIGALKSMAIAMIFFGFFSLNAFVHHLEAQENLGVDSSFGGQELYAEEDYDTYNEDYEQLMKLLKETSLNTGTEGSLKGGGNVDRGDFKDLVTLSQKWLSTDEPDQLMTATAKDSFVSTAKQERNVSEVGQKKQW